MLRLFLIAMCIGLYSSESLRASERLGTLSVDQVVLKPRVETSEPFRVDMNLGESYASFLWSYQEDIRAHFAVGTLNILGRTSWVFTETERTTQELGFTDVYGEYLSPYGHVKFGLQPIPFGIEGGRDESQTVFQRPLLYKKGLVPLRDIGFSFSTDHRSFFMNFSVHNGESGANSDGRVWITGNWGWSANRRFRLGVMGTVGSYREETTANSEVDFGGFDNTEESEWRMGGVFVSYVDRVYEVRLQGITGNLIQDEEDKAGLTTGHLDVIYKGQGFWSILFRADYFEPNFEQSKDDLTEVSLGFSVGNKYGTSSLAIIGTKSFDPVEDLPNETLMMQWKLRP